MPCKTGGERPEKIALTDCRDLYFLLDRFDRDGSVGVSIGRGDRSAAVTRQQPSGGSWLMELSVWPEGRSSVQNSAATSPTAAV